MICHSFDNCHCMTCQNVVNYQHRFEFLSFSCQLSHTLPLTGGHSCTNIGGRMTNVQICISPSTAVQQLLCWFPSNSPLIIIFQKHKKNIFAQLLCIKTNDVKERLKSCCQFSCNLGFCHSPVDFRAHSRSLPLTPTHSCSLPLTPVTPTHADARISTEEWQKPWPLHDGCSLQLDSSCAEQNWVEFGCSGQDRGSRQH